MNEDTVKQLADAAYTAWVDYLNHLGTPKRHDKWRTWREAGEALAVELGSEEKPDHLAASAMVHEMRQQAREGGAK
jgi:hypothetical protein